MSDDDLTCDAPGCEARVTIWKRVGEHMGWCPRHTPSAENILVDLIAELSVYKKYTLLDEYRPINHALRKAETRLREMQGE